MLFRIQRIVQKFGSISNFTNWEKDVVEAKTPVIVDFYATWCGPCKRLTPLLEQKVQAHPNATLVKIDIDKFESVAAKHNVQAVPTVLLFKDGKQIDQFVGLPPQEKINQFFEHITKQH